VNGGILRNERRKLVRTLKNREARQSLTNHKGERSWSKKAEKGKKSALNTKFPSGGGLEDRENHHTPRTKDSFFGKVFLITPR